VVSDVPAGLRPSFARQRRRVADLVRSFQLTLVLALVIGVLTGPRDPVADVASRLREADADAGVVIDAGHVVGVVTRHDLANVEVLLDRLAGETSAP
jgi:CBS domain-containing protein